jgi:4-amino-4-deoxy-L-arabinose transferase-like glycosyltransferase
MNVAVAEARASNALEIEMAERLALAAVLIVYAVWIVAFGWPRDVLGYGTETDFIGGFVVEAQSFIAGQPLQSTFHPPLYPMLLGAVYDLTGDWFRAGLIISFVSGAVVLVASWLLVRALYGRICGFGALVGLAAAPAFLAYAISATSDVPFLALLLAASAAAVLAAQRQDWGAAGIAGVLAALTLLTRTNGVTLMLLGALPLLGVGPWSARLRSVGAFAVGAAAPILAMAVFAAVTGSSVVPAGTVDNLAMTLYADGDRQSGDALRQVVGQFDSLGDVIAHDPVRVAAVYLRDLWRLAIAGIPALLGKPLTLLAVPGLVWLLSRRTGLLGAGVLVVFGAQLALLNLKQFEPRFYIYLTPLLGAGLAATFLLAFHLARGRAHVALTGIAVAATGLAVVNSVRLANGSVERDAAEVESFLAAGLQRHVPTGALVVARKPHLAFYAHASGTTIPATDDLARLRVALSELDHPGEVLVFFGEVEARTRPELGALRDPERAPAWLEPIATSLPAGGWTLYRLRHERTD